MAKENPPPRTEETIRSILSWGVLIAACALFAGFALFLTLELWRADNWMLDIIQAHFAATVLLPIALLEAFCIVMLLKFATGPIELEALGFKFRGAAGPVILWIFSFLAIVTGIRLLW